MHLVFASSLVPCGAPQSGFDIANHAIVDGLRRQGVRVTHFGFKWPGVPLADPDATVCLGEIDPKTDSAGTRQKLAWLGTAIREGLTFSSAKLRFAGDAAVKSAFDAIADVDAVVINGVPLGGAYEKLLTSLPFIFVAHNVEHISARASAQAAGGLFERVLFQREAIYLKRLEKRLCDRARFVLTLTNEDRKDLGLDDDARARALPLVTPWQEPPSIPRFPAFDVGLIGTWTWAPNRIGLEWLLQDVLPLLPKEMTVAVAGTLPKNFPRRDKRVTFLGRVDDAKDFARQCRVIALASRAGTGVQLKTIETFEMGLPAVATPSSVRGMASLPANVAIADTASTFAEALKSHVQGQRTGAIEDVDGTVFRKRQLVDMNYALRDALASLGAR